MPSIGSRIHRTPLSPLAVAGLLAENRVVRDGPQNRDHLLFDRPVGGGHHVGGGRLGRLAHPHRVPAWNGPVRRPDRTTWMATSSNSVADGAGRMITSVGSVSILSGAPAGKVSRNNRAPCPPGTGRSRVSALQFTLALLRRTSPPAPGSAVLKTSHPATRQAARSCTGPAGEASLALRLGKVVRDISPPDRRRRPLTRRHADRACSRHRWSADVGWRWLKRSKVAEVNPAQAKKLLRSPRRGRVSPWWSTIVRNGRRRVAAARAATPASKATTAKAATAPRAAAATKPAAAPGGDVAYR